MEDGIGQSQDGTERRLAAPHPGPLVKRDYLDPLGIDPASFAAHLGMDPDVLAAMLAGRVSLDVPSAVRMARALQLPAEKLMQMQVRYDFAVARASRALDGIELLRPAPADAFPARHLSGRLGCSSGGVGGHASLFFQEDALRRLPGDGYAGLHALWPEDRMRVYDGSAELLWHGPVLQDFDGRIFLPFVRSSVWRSWFVASHRADLALGPEHAAALEKAPR